ncbi:MAG TPA: hypothetical protein VJU86_01540 [Pyrinomonadaceae bacterium]|nr:hypothetical protein [Pyrinomonadaceae bacterium]
MKSQVDQAQTPRRSKTRVLLLITLALLIISVVGAFAWWRYFKTTPTYSLAVLIDAAQRDDAQAFDTVFDTDKVVENFLSDQAQKPQAGYLPNLSVSLRDRLKSAPPSVVTYVKTGIREGVRRRINELGESAGNAPIVLTALVLYFKTHLRVDGEKATVSISRNDQKLELGMLRNNDHWRVVSAKDDALAARIIANLAKDLPSELSPLDLAKPLKDALPKLPLIP